MDNTMLETFYKNNVKLTKDETKEILDFVKPIIDYIVQYVHEKDKRFKLHQLNVVSYYSRLKVSRADEFDYSIVLDSEPYWGWTTVTPAYYKFDGNKEVVQSLSPLPPAPVGEYVTNFSATIPEWNKKRLNEGPACLTIGYHIIPLKVKKRFKALVSETVKQPCIRQYVDAKRLSESPAVTLTIADPNVAAEPISVDLAPLIEAHLPFRPEFNWHRPGVGWPSSTQIKDLKDEGIHLVAKDPEYWSLSFVTCEKNC
ncbi:cyclic GMP-AMP synthase-like receptor 1 [Mytilus edulis]|uniref:cyclic GMP-AMP synthase-like receptor 1 n=1 Tax=Mytilus edulis TaxID=6550 RepID=UPI0039EEABBC